MPEANAEGTLKKPVITTILNILIKTTSFRSEHQLCEVRTERQNKKIFSFLKNKNGGRKRSHFVQEQSDWIQNAMLGGMSRAVTK